jgi:hypothetical protein
MWPAGRRPGCSATASGASASASSAWAASAQAVARRAKAFGLQIHYHNRRRSRRDRGGAGGDLLGKPRPDAGAHGHRLGQLPAHAGDLSPAVGAPAEADEADAYIVNTARGEVIDENALIRMLEAGDSPAPASTCSSTSRRSIRSCSSSPRPARWCCCRIWARRRSRAASTWARRSSSTSRPSWTATSRRTACCHGRQRQPARTPADRRCGRARKIDRPQIVIADRDGRRDREGGALALRRRDRRARRDQPEDRRAAAVAPSDVVENGREPGDEISLEDARRSNPAAQVGDTIADRCRRSNSAASPRSPPSRSSCRRCARPSATASIRNTRTASARSSTASSSASNTAT